MGKLRPGQSQGSIYTEGAFDRLQGVDAWRRPRVRRPKSHFRTIGSNEHVDGYDVDGVPLDEIEIVVWDVDETFPRL